MTSEAPSDNTPSNRLIELLSQNGSYKDLKGGLVSQLSKLTGVSYTACRKWLFEDSLPRDPQERIAIAGKLGIDLIYWEYGYEYSKKTHSDFKEDSLFQLKVSNEVLAILYENSIKLTADKKIELENIATIIANETGNPEPNTAILKSLIDLLS